MSAIDSDLLVHLVKHGMEDEVRQYLSHGQTLETKRYDKPEPERPHDADYIVGASLNPGDQLDGLSFHEQMYRRSPPIAELTVHYLSGRYQVFVGEQAKEFAPPVIQYCKWFATDAQVRGPAPELPSALI